MDCRDVRRELAERALGTLDPDVGRWVDRHVAWCAGCRREAEELAEGAAALPLAVGGPLPPPTLEARVVRTVAREARRPARGRRVALVAAVLGALVAAGSLAWALSVRDRLGILQRAERGARQRAEISARELEALIKEIAGRPALSATLVPEGRGEGGGRAIVYDSPQGRDFAVIVLGGLPARTRYHAAVVTPGGVVSAGRLEETDPGRLSLLHYFDRDVAGATEVLVRDARGRDVLRGTLGAYAG